MTPSEVTFLRRLASDKPAVARNDGVAARMLKDHQIGRLQGSRVFYGERDFERAANMLLNRRVPLQAPREPFTRSQAPSGGSEKTGALPVTHGLVGVVPIQMESTLSVPRGAILMMPWRDALALPYEVVVLSENLQPMLEMHEYEWLDGFVRSRPALAIFRGATGLLRPDAAAALLATDTRPVLAFFDFDPKGLSMAASIRSISLDPSWRQPTKTQAGKAWSSRPVALNALCQNISHGDEIVTDRSILVMLRQYFAEHPIEIVLIPAADRMMILGAITAIFHLVYYVVWTVYLPQNYESLSLRLFMSATGVVMMIGAFRNNLETPIVQGLYLVLIFLQVPFFFFFMYLMNGADRVWLGSVALIIVALFSLTDWRLALPLLALGAATAAVVWLRVSPPGQPNPVTAPDLVVGTFSVIAGSALGAFSASIRRARLLFFNETMGVLAHELRTPLSANGILAEAIQDQSENIESPQVRATVARLGRRVQAVTDTMNHHIDLQIINARMLRIPAFQTRMLASDLVQLSVAQYPFRSKTQQECVRILINEDFAFIGDPFYFGKVLDNLIGNAMKSLQEASSDFSVGKLTLALSTRNGWGVLTVADYGMGIAPGMKSRLFKPHSSTNRDGSHGLGLYFCKRVVERAGGRISVTSTELVGARFEIILPIAPNPTGLWSRTVTGLGMKSSSARHTGASGL